jgi:hypothetical protein
MEVAICDTAIETILKYWSLLWGKSVFRSTVPVVPGQAGFGKNILVLLPVTVAGNTTILPRLFIE